MLYNSGGAVLYNSGGSNPIWANRVVMHRVPRAVRRAAAPPRRVSVKGAGRERALSVVGAPRVLGVVIHPGGRLGRVDQNGLPSIWL